MTPGGQSAVSDFIGSRTASREQLAHALVIQGAAARASILNCSAAFSCAFEEIPGRMIAEATIKGMTPTTAHNAPILMLNRIGQW